MWASAVRDGEIVDGKFPTLKDKEMSLSITVSGSKGLAEIVRTKDGKSTTVQFIHESVRDFLVRDKGLQELWPELGVEWKSQGHDLLRSACEVYLGRPAINRLISSYDTLSEHPGTR